ncbi:MAG: ATP-binding protein [Clostridiales bacterium]|jgi:DNA replication protein DnaC|nr:ATP-binding protein [Clostridiales bacterium]
MADRSSGSYRRIEAILEDRRAGAARELEARRRRAFALCPEIEALEGEAAKLGAACCRRIVSGELAAGQAQAMLSERAAADRGRRAALLEAAGLPADYLAPSPSCALCGDTGYVAGEGGRPERCACFRRLLTETLFAASNIAPSGAGAGAPGFGSFDETLFSPDADAKKYGHPISPRENILKIRDSALDFVSSFGEPPFLNLYFYGRAGTGKTFMASAIADALLRGGHVALYLPATALFNAITEYRTRAFRDDDYSDYTYRSILDAELLIIDDLGTESMTNARYAEFITLLNARVSAGAGAAGGGEAAMPPPAMPAMPVPPILGAAAAAAGTGMGPPAGAASGGAPAGPLAAAGLPAKAPAGAPKAAASGTAAALVARLGAAISPGAAPSGPPAPLPQQQAAWAYAGPPAAAPRRARPRSTIISTNMDLRALRNTYDERVVSRIIGSFAIIPFFGEDIRLARRAARPGGGISGSAGVTGAGAARPRDAIGASGANRAGGGISGGGVSGSAGSAPAPLSRNPL